MPELPEVETMRRGVAGIAGGRIMHVERPPCTRKPIRITPRIDALRHRTVGRHILHVDRLGKRVVLRVDSGDSLIFEPRMTGLVLVADPPSEEHLRLRIELSGGGHEQLLYWDRRGLGSVYLLTPAELNSRLGEAALGPDALSISCERLREQLHRSRRAIKVALLDQTAVAGIGNLYAAEILHRARVHPARRCDQLTRPQWQRVHEAIGHVLEEAIRHEGSTLSDGTYRNALNNPGSYQSQHRVYNREGQSCPVCSTGRVRRIVQAQRSTFFCPVCQRSRQASSKQ